MTEERRVGWVEGGCWRGWTWGGGGDVVPVFLGDGEGERHADGGVGGIFFN